MKRNHLFTVSLAILNFNFSIGMEGDIFNISFIEDTLFTLDKNNHNTKSLRDGEWDDLHKYDQYRRKELCLIALLTVFGDVKKTKELENLPVPKAQIFKELRVDKYSLKPTEHNILYANVISCPYSVPLYVYKKKDHDKILPFVAKYPFKFRDYVFDFEFVISIKYEEEEDSLYLTERDIKNHIFHKLEFGDRWELCYEARKYVREEITIEFSYTERPGIYEFKYPFGGEEHIAIDCPTEPGMWLRIKDNNTIMIARTFEDFEESDDTESESIESEPSDKSDPIEFDDPE